MFAIIFAFSLAAALTQQELLTQVGLTSMIDAFSFTEMTSPYTVINCFFNNLASQAIDLADAFASISILHDTFIKCAATSGYGEVIHLECNTVWIQNVYGADCSGQKDG
jgi:hypothetical protein